MKKILILTLVIICGVAFSDGWAKRPKKNQPAQELTAAEGENRKAFREKIIAERIDSLKRVAELREQEDKEWKMNIPYQTGPARQPIQLLFPCLSESYDSDEYWGGYGHGFGNTTQAAMRCALMVAIQDIQSKGISDISNIQVVCQKISQDSDGEYECHLAIHVPMKNESDSLKADNQILLMDSVQRDSLRQVFKEKFDSLLNVQKPQLQNNITE